jgi:hypothetical protein
MAISTILLDIMFVVYVIAGIGLVIYGFSCYYSIYLFLKNSRTTRLSDRKKILQFYREHSMDELPQVTTQLPVFNEANCVERLLEAVKNNEKNTMKENAKKLEAATPRNIEKDW